MLWCAGFALECLKYTLCYAPVVCSVQQLRLCAMYSEQWFWLCCIAFADLEWASLAAWVTHRLCQPLLCKKASHFVKGDIIMKWKFR